MERLDREDQHQAVWEAKKVFVNTSRVETLDRLAKQCVMNDEKQVGKSWAQITDLAVRLGGGSTAFIVCCWCHVFQG